MDFLIKHIKGGKLFSRVKDRPDRVAHDTDDTKVRNLPLFTKIMNA